MKKNVAKFAPVSGVVTPRFAGVATFMRLPLLPLEDVGAADIALVGVPWDGGTTNRSGARHGPRQVREMSAMIRPCHHSSGVLPFALCNVADFGDAPVNPADPQDALKRVGDFFAGVVSEGAAPFSVGGDHLITLPVLRALARDGPLGMIQVDAHADTWDSYFGGSRFTHGTVFRRAIEEGLLDAGRIVQVGLRGGLYDLADKEWGPARGVRTVEVEEFCDKGPAAIASEARSIVGDGPLYVSFDIDGIDPGFAPGTGTPEVGGIYPREAQIFLRGLRGLNIVGADVVEVSPPFDPGGGTALTAATMMFEILCAAAERRAAEKSRQVRIQKKSR